MPTCCRWERGLRLQLLECVWPEGERLRTGGRRDMRSLTLSVRRQGELFALSGELNLDDGRVLELRLQQIALLGGDGRDLTLNALTLPFLSSLAAEAGWKPAATSARYRC